MILTSECCFFHSRHVKFIQFIISSFIFKRHLTFAAVIVCIASTCVCVLLLLKTGLPVFCTAYLVQTLTIHTHTHPHKHTHHSLLRCSHCALNKADWLMGKLWDANRTNQEATSLHSTSIGIKGCFFVFFFSSFLKGIRQNYNA